MKAIVLALFVAIPAFAQNSWEFTNETCTSSSAKQSFKCPAYVNECATPAQSKFIRKAAQLGFTIALDTMVASDVSDEMFNPTKYVWFDAQAFDPEGNMHTLRV